MSRVMTQQVLTYEERLYCTDCEGDHEMEWNGISLTVHPPLFPHVCLNCGHRVNISGHTYPMTRYTPTGDLQEL